MGAASLPSIRVRTICSSLNKGSSDVHGGTEGDACLGHMHPVDPGHSVERDPVENPYGDAIMIDFMVGSAIVFLVLLFSSGE